MNMMDLMERLARLEREVFGMSYEEARNFLAQFDETMHELELMHQPETEIARYYNANTGVISIAEKVVGA